jgi:hypothetical protein
MAGSAVYGDVSAEVRALTGSRARIVWVQHTGDGADIFAHGDSLRLMGLDTDDGRGEREILPATGAYHKPLITPSGKQIVFSSFPAQIVYVVAWDGSGLREFVHGIAAAVWQDPRTRVEWVYVQTGKEAGVEARNNPIWRYRLDDPKVGELVWDKTPTNPEGFQVSRDGTRAVSLFPWPHFGVANLPNGSVTELGQGCCASLAPGGADLAFHLLGDHRHLMMYALDTGMMWKVELDQAPGVDGFESYHPTWSNTIRIMSMCGPFRGSGGVTAEIYVGRFDANMRTIESWVRVTHNEKGDFYPDVWIEPDSTPPGRLTLSGNLTRGAPSLH